MNSTLFLSQNFGVLVLLIGFLIVLISTFGLLMIYSSSYYTASMNPKTGYDGSFYMKKQAWNVLFGLVVMIVVSKLDYHKLVKWFGK